MSANHLLQVQHLLVLEISLGETPLDIVLVSLVDVEKAATGTVGVPRALFVVALLGLAAIFVSAMTVFQASPDRHLLLQLLSREALTEALQHGVVTNLLDLLRLQPLLLRIRLERVEEGHGGGAPAHLSTAVTQVLAGDHHGDVVGHTCQAEHQVICRARQRAESLIEDDGVEESRAIQHSAGAGRQHEHLLTSCLRQIYHPSEVLSWFEWF
mmetsp:Transcript_24476/g.33582  ORF Transcript_24476/g.33582 Transcript_24476/m.33582 type:complete len:212 (+) Transcript_24476:387-1022(+)